MTIEKHIRGLPERWQNYFLSLLFHMFLPLIPLLFEFWKTGLVGIKSLMLATSIYSISISVASRSKLFFGVGVLVGLFFAGAYGLSFADPSPLAYGVEISCSAIFSIFTIHSLERWNIHVVAREPYWLF